MPDPRRISRFVASRSPAVRCASCSLFRTAFRPDNSIGFHEWTPHAAVFLIRDFDTGRVESDWIHLDNTMEWRNGFCSSGAHTRLHSGTVRGLLHDPHQLPQPVRPPLSQDRVTEFERQGARYLMNETTAVTRFVFPYADDREVARIRYLFGALFVRRVVEDVKGEEQIRLIESRSQNRVHIWSSFDRCA